MKTKFLATGIGNFSVPVSDNPREAAIAFFLRYPTKKVCHVAEVGVKYQSDGRVVFIYEPGYRMWPLITRQQINEVLPEA